ncbi:MAG: nicotinate-nucleotide adenylyltransferase [Gemmatimonadota bacterium]|nr:nicotinate-nucleotide adenylyltransferase [Gemmatimonadota bacterium]
MRIGLIGGTFDPVHLGHLIGAETARCELELDKVFFVPAANPPHKLKAPVTEAAHRIEMLRRAIAGNECFGLCLDEIERGGSSYTIDTLRRFRKGLKPQDELFFILGADNLCEFDTWKEWQEICRESRIAVLAREGYVHAGSIGIDKPGGMEIIKVRMPLVDISATGIRSDFAAGRSIRYRVPVPVAEYIEAHGLYS